MFEAVGRRIASGRQWTMTMCVRWKAGWRVWLADRKAGRERRAGACMAPKGEAGRAWLAFSGGALARPAGGRVSGRISMPSSRPRPRHHHRPCRLSAHAAAPEVASARTRSRCGTPASEPRKARQRASAPGTVHRGCCPRCQQHEPGPLHSGPSAHLLLLRRTPPRQENQPQQQKADTRRPAAVASLSLSLSTLRRIDLICG